MPTITKTDHNFFNQNKTSEIFVFELFSSLIFAKMHMNCPSCGEWRDFKSRRAASIHMNNCQEKKERLKQAIKNLENSNFSTNSIHNKQQNNDTEEFFFDCNDKEEDIESNTPTDDENHFFDTTNTSLLERHKDHMKANFKEEFGKNNPDYNSGIHLLDILRRAKTPLTYFDEIIEWAKKSTEIGVEFDACYQCDRKKLLSDIDKLFDLHGLKSKEEKYTLKTTGEEVTVVYVEFLEALYSLFNDPDVMHPDNLIDEDDDDGEGIDDVHTGSVWKEAKRIYIKKSAYSKTCSNNFFH